MFKSEKSKGNKHASLWRRLLLALLGVILGVNIYLVNAGRLLGNSIPMPFGIGLAVVQSGSMEPTYYKGDLLFVKEQDSYQVNDIVVYQSGRMLVVHRIIDIDGDYVTTQGDFNNAADTPFDISLIKGGVIFRIPAVGLVVDFLKTPIGILLLIGCATLLVELSFRREKKTGEQENAELRSQIEKLRRELGTNDN